MEKKFVLLPGIILFIQCMVAQIAIPPSAGNGSQANPYQIATLENLYWIASTPNDSLWTNVYFVQMANINASATIFWSDTNGQGWVPIGQSFEKRFMGNYNGNGHIIDSLFINRPESDDQGLFGYCNGYVENLGMTNVNITGGNEVGSFIGTSLASWLRNCYSTGNISGTNKIGGLVGEIDLGFGIMNSYSKANVDGNSTIGGLVGNALSTIPMDITIDYCYATGKITGNSRFGGLLGWVYIFYVPRGPKYLIMNHSYWDTVTSGVVISTTTSDPTPIREGTGKNTSEMKTASTFSNAGWSSSIWYMDAEINDGYPYLSWQNPSGTPLPKIAAFHGSSTRIDFGIVQIDTTKKDSVCIANPGNDTLRVTIITSSNGCFVFAPTTMAIEPSSTAYLVVTFTPEDTSQQFGYIFLTHNASGSPDTIAVAGKGAIITTVGGISEIPTRFAIEQNYPNPFNPSTVVSYQLPVTSQVSLKVYDILGHEVATLVNGVVEAGYHSMTFNAADLASGIYFYRIVAGNFAQTRKLVVMK
jgi:hypothetical protein